MPAFVQMGIKDYRMMCSKLYGELRDPTIHYSITQTVVREDVSAANAYRTLFGSSDR